jgi:hypothetical protein
VASRRRKGVVHQRHQKQGSELLGGAMPLQRFRCKRGAMRRSGRWQRHHL